jgi:hypothetical protein
VTGWLSFDVEPPREGEIAVEVLADHGMARCRPALAVNDRRVAGPAYGHYTVIQGWRVQRGLLEQALGLRLAPGRGGEGDEQARELVYEALHSLFLALGKGSEDFERGLAAGRREAAVAVEKAWAAVAVDQPSRLEVEAGPLGIVLILKTWRRATEIAAGAPDPEQASGTKPTLLGELLEREKAQIETLLRDAGLIPAIGDTVSLAYESPTYGHGATFREAAEELVVEYTPALSDARVVELGLTVEGRRRGLPEFGGAR